MNIKEARSILSEQGIYQLNQGETLANALNSVKNRTTRSSKAAFEGRVTTSVCGTDEKIIANLPSKSQYH